jgi:hypothetical protein
VILIGLVISLQDVLLLAEYMALAYCVQEAIHLRRSLKDLGFEQNEATSIMEDNQGCIAMSANPINHQRTKHIDIRYHFTRERIVSGEVDVKYVATGRQIADVLTKPLERIKLEKFRSYMLGSVGA